MRHKYTDAEFDFIKNNCKGITSYELTERFNKNFNIDLTRSQIKAYMKNHSLTSDIERNELKKFNKSKYTDEQIKFIKDNVNGIGTKELTELINNKFGLNLNTIQVKSFKGNNNLSSGLDGRYVKGSIPFNKGMKGICAKGCEKTWFKKGQESLNRRDVGSERITVDGYTEVKILEPNKWRLKHQLEWEKHKGPIPNGHAVIFGNGDRQNTDINNLILVSRQQLLILNKNKLIQNDAELTRTGVIIADVYQKIIKIKSSSQAILGY